MALVQAVVIGLVALILSPRYFFYYDVTPKLVVLLLGAAVCALAWRGERPARALTLVTVCAALSLAVSAALSSSPALSVFGSTWRRFGLVAQTAVLLLAWLVAGNGDRARLNILRGVAVASGIAALYGIAQYFGWDPLLPAAGYHIGEGVWTIVRPPGTLGYVSYFATWLLIGGFLCLSLANSETAAAWRRVGYGCAGLCFTAMLLTGTRAALLGAAVGAVAAGYRLGFRISRGALTGGVLLLAALATFYVSPPGWRLRSRTRWFREDPWGGARPLLWRDSLRMAVARPLAGFGPEVFTATFPHFESKELARAYPDFAHESPHNIFLDALVSGGLPGLACLVAFCAIGMGAAWRGKRPWIIAALAAGITAQQFTVFTIPTALLLFVTIALAVAPEPARRASAVRVPMLAAAALMLYCAFRYAAADRELELARQSIDAHEIRTAAFHYNDYLQRKLPGASAALWYSRALLDARAVLAAGQAALAATRVAEDPFDAWYNLAEVYAIGNSTAETETCLRRAAAANPTWFKPHWTLAQVLRLEGRTPEAVSEAALAADLDGGKHPEVGRTLDAIRALQK